MRAADAPASHRASSTTLANSANVKARAAR
jgi:hypothetical protein